MTQEEKRLLLKDLCARLPYGVKVQCFYDNKEVVNAYAPATLTQLDTKKKCAVFNFEVPINSIRPYLRPMSSMTEEEKKEWHYLYLPLPHKNEATETERRIDWLNKNMFDYRGLIPMGLALEAPEGMYKTE